MQCELQRVEYQFLKTSSRDGRSGLLIQTRSHVMVGPTWRKLSSLLSCALRELPKCPRIPFRNRNCRCFNRETKRSVSENDGDNVQWLRWWRWPMGTLIRFLSPLMRVKSTWIRWFEEYFSWFFFFKISKT